MFAQEVSGGAAAAGGAAGAPPAGARPPGGCNDPMSLVLMLGMLVVFYFLLIRPQQKKAKAHKAMVEGLKRGDSVVLHSGVFGRITAIEGNTMKVEIAKNTEIKVLKGYVLGQATPDNEKNLADTPQQPGN
jgi:preprotein translocase subunit YajC